MLRDEVQDEITSLKAIYSTDYEDIDKQPDELNNTSFKIKIRPLSDEVHAFVTIQFTIGIQYPEKVPDIVIVDNKGLSKNDCEELSKLLKSAANSYKGTVMIYELTTKAQLYIAARNRKPKNLNEEMKSRQLREEEVMRSIWDDSSEQPSDASTIKVDDSSQMNTTINNAINKFAISSSTRNSFILKSMNNNSFSQLESNDENESSQNSESQSDQDREESNFFDSNSSISRYYKEFREISRLGEGSFGEVWKVRNRLDRRVYAVKKIALDPKSEGLNRKIRREVTTISRLIHKHIVRYYAAWLEIETDNYKEEDSNGSVKRTKQSAMEQDDVSSSSYDSDDSSPSTVDTEEDDSSVNESDASSSSTSTSSAFESNSPSALKANNNNNNNAALLIPGHWNQTHENEEPFIQFGDFETPWQSTKAMSSSPHVDSSLEEGTILNF